MGIRGVGPDDPVPAGQERTLARAHRDLADRRGRQDEPTDQDRERGLGREGAGPLIEVDGGDQLGVAHRTILSAPPIPGAQLATAATPQTFAVTSPASTLSQHRSQPPRRTGWPRTAPWSLSARFEPVPRLWSLTTDSCRMPLWPRSPDSHHLAVLARPGFVSAASRLPRRLPDQAALSSNRAVATARREGLPPPSVPAPHGAINEVDRFRRSRNPHGKCVLSWNGS